MITQETQCIIINKTRIYIPCTNYIVTSFAKIMFYFIMYNGYYIVTQIWIRLGLKFYQYRKYHLIIEYKIKQSVNNGRSI